MAWYSYGEIQNLDLANYNLGILLDVKDIIKSALI